MNAIRNYESTTDTHSGVNISYSTNQTKKGVGLVEEPENKS